jgi:hypothetical protein
MTSFSQALHVVARYHQDLNAENVAQSIRTELNRFEPILIASDRWNPTEAGAIESAIAAHLQPIYHILRRARQNKNPGRSRG